jgi:hypothetical protein
MIYRIKSVHTYSLKTLFLSTSVSIHIIDGTLLIAKNGHDTSVRKLTKIHIKLIKN